MGKIKAWYRSIPLWLAIFLYAASALLLASFVSGKITGAAYKLMGVLNVEYSVILTEDGRVGRADSGDLSYFTTTYNSDDVDLEDSGSVKVYKMHFDFDSMPSDDKMKYGASRIIVSISPFLIYSAFLLSAALAFYFTKLKKPLSLLSGASENIAKSDFDFSIHYSGRDEMAKLCGTFEKMRYALYENDRRMNQMIEERKQLNDAYTHDLRTPVAVLKGCADTLSEYLPTGQLPKEKVIETVRIMSSHVERLGQFVDSMNAVQKLSDLPLRREAVPTRDFVAGLRETTTVLCEKQNISVRIDSAIGSDTLKIDLSAVAQVFENLLSNALRFAKTSITVDVSEVDSALLVRVADDGAGFSPKELISASTPYYCGRHGGGEEKYHLGLGLHICKTLCEKHGGSLTLENADGGGAVVTAKFSM